MNHGSGTHGPRDKVTMKTIAEEAGVTLTTVSRILNQKGGKYAETTRTQIFEIADRLKYRPNALVHGMQTGKTGTAGVMVPAEDLWYSQVVAGIHQVFIEHDIIMLLSWNNRTVNQREETLERKIIHQMIDRRVEGIILRPSSEEFERSYFEEIWERDIPLILIDRPLSKIETDFVGTDDVRGGQAAAEYLISLGHRQMLFMGYDHASTSGRREEGFRKVLSESPNAAGSSIPWRDWKELVLRLQSTPAPTALLCYNDALAREAAAILLQEGLSIPKDISLVGFGNVPTTDASLPLTTFDQHPQEIGATAARLYLDRVNSLEPNGNHQQLIPADLIVRSSTRPVQ